MVDNNLLEPAVADSIAASEVIVSGEASKGPFAAYFLEHVRRYLERRYGADRIYHDGLRVYTTLDPYLQRVAEDSLEARLLKIENHTQL